MSYLGVNTESATFIWRALNYFEIHNEIKYIKEMNCCTVLRHRKWLVRWDLHLYNFIVFASLRRCRSRDSGNPLTTALTTTLRKHIKQTIDKGSERSNQDDWYTWPDKGLGMKPFISQTCILTRRLQMASSSPNTSSPTTLLGLAGHFPPY